MLFSSSNEFVPRYAPSAIQSLFNTDRDGLAMMVFSDAGVIEIIAPFIHSTNCSIASLAQAIISAIEVSLHCHGLDNYASMELLWTRALVKLT